MAEGVYYLRDLMAAAAAAEGTTVNERQVRLFITHGLLPPAQGRGGPTHYGEEHLLRLRLSLRLAAQYVPPREIRQCLDGLPYQGLRALVERAPLPRLPTEGDAQGYLARLVADLPPSWTAPLPAFLPARSGPATPAPLRRRPARTPAAHQALPSPREAQPRPEHSEWVRVVVDPDVELLVRIRPGGGRQQLVDGLVEALQRALGAERP